MKVCCLKNQTENCLIMYKVKRQWHFISDVKCKLAYYEIQTTGNSCFWHSGSSYSKMYLFVMVLCLYH